MSRRHGGAQSAGLNVGYGNYDYSNTNYDNTKRTVSNPYVAAGNGAELYSPKKSKNNSNLFSGFLKFLPWLSTTILLALYITTRVQLSSANYRVKKVEKGLDDEIRSCTRRVDQLNNSNSDLKSQAKKHVDEIRRVRADFEAETSRLSSEVAKKNDLIKMKEDKIELTKDIESKVTDLQKREHAWMGRVQLLTQKIARESFREALERFGPGPHKVKFEVELPRDSEKDATLPEGAHPFFVIQLHPLKNMPHAVHLFLEQAYHGLWDGCSFVVNAPHILQAGTFPGGTSSKTYAEKIKEFEEVGLDVLSYQEYDRLYPHVQWSVGFAGRPGGPDFFINKMDNTKNHGPGGQRHHTFGEEADPCFGFVSEGKEVLERMYVMQTDAKNDWVMEKPVHIVRARIIEGPEDNIKYKDTVTGKAIPHLSEMHGMDIPDDRMENVSSENGVKEKKPLPPLPKNMQGDKMNVKAEGDSPI